MKFAVVAMFLVVVQASAPIPRKAADQSTSARNKIKQDASNQKHSSQAGMRIPTSTESNQSEGKEQRHYDACETVIIREPAAMPHKDRWDKAAVIFAGLLVLVGGFGVGYAVKTLQAIEGQAGIMRGQLHKMAAQVAEMQNAGKQTERIIENMKDTAERELRAYVCISSAQIAFLRERAPEIHVRIKNYGKTPAHHVQMWIGAALGAYPLEHALASPPEGFHMSTDILAPDAKPHTLVFRHPAIASEYMPILGTPKLTLYAYGEVTYRDAFGKQQSTKYRLIHGGREPAILKNYNGVAKALLKADTEGNEAT